MADDGVRLEVRPEDLEFRVRVPAGCVIVAALRLPSGQLVELSDLVADDAAGVPVGDPLRTPGVGPVDERKVRAAREAARDVREVEAEHREARLEALEREPPREDMGDVEPELPSDRVAGRSDDVIHVDERAWFDGTEGE